MKITVEIPDEMVGDLVREGRTPEAEVLEAVALEGYRSRRLGEEDVRRLLGLVSRLDVHALLAQRGMYLNYNVEHDLEVAREDGQRWRAERAAKESERLAR
jgi:predicted HTH domain antitoxin